jgi:hypothetical protein
VSDHEITIRPHYLWNGEDWGAFDLYCSCGVWLMEDVDEITELQEINAVAKKHLDAMFDLDESRALAADVPAQGYVHGLDPAEEDPRNGVLE